MSVSKAATAFLVATVTFGLGCTPWTNNGSTPSQGTPTRAPGRTPLTAAPELPAGITTTTMAATPQNPESTTPTSSADVPGLSMSPAPAGATCSTSALSDAQIAEIADEADRAAVEQGRYAALRARDPRVRAFAQQVVATHSYNRQRMTSLLRTEHLVPAESAVSTKMAADDDGTFRALKSSTVAELDRAYIDVQVKAYQDLLDTLDNELIPNARDRELKSQLQALRPLVAEQLREAKEIQGTTRVVP